MPLASFGVFPPPSSSVFIAVWQHFLPAGRRCRGRRLILAASTQPCPPLTSHVTVSTSQYTFSVFTAAPCVSWHVRVKLKSKLNLCSTKLLTHILQFSVGSETLWSFSKFHHSVSTIWTETQVYFFPKNGRTATFEMNSWKMCTNHSGATFSLLGKLSAESLGWCKAGKKNVFSTRKNVSSHHGFYLKMLFECVGRAPDVCLINCASIWAGIWPDRLQQSYDEDAAASRRCVETIRADGERHVSLTW